MIEFRLREIMKEKNIKLRELAEMTGLSTNTLSMLSTGKSKGIQFDTLDKILTSTKIEIGDLIHHSGVYLNLSLDIFLDEVTEKSLKYNLFFNDNNYILEVDIEHYETNKYTTFSSRPNDEFKNQDKYFNQSVLELISTLMIKELADNDLIYLTKNPESMLIFDWTNIYSFGVGLPIKEIIEGEPEAADHLVYKAARKFPNVKIDKNIIFIPYSSIGFTSENEEN